MQKKTKGTHYNVDVVKRLREKYGVSQRFIQMSLRGDRVSETSEKIISDYKIMELELNKTLKAL